MNTSIKYEQLAKLSGTARMKALASAIDFEMKKPALVLEMSIKAAISNVIGKGFAANDPRNSINHERIKSFLAAKYNTPSDTPELVDVANQFEQFFHTNMPEMDMGYVQLFDLVDLRASVHDHFDIIDTNAGITFTQREPGEETKIRRRISESKTSVSLLEFSDGIGILDRWLDRQMFWNIDEVVTEFRSKYFDKKAEMHYLLLTALGTGIDQAFDTDDVTTANTAAAAIIRATKNSGYAVGESPSFYAVCSPEKVGRLEKLLTAQRGSAIVDQGTVSEPLAHRITGIISTTHVSAADTGWYLVLPGRKMKRGEFKDLTIEDTRNIYVSATDLVAVGQYNAAIGDSNQVRRVRYA